MKIIKLLHKKDWGHERFKVSRYIYSLLFGAFYWYLIEVQAWAGLLTDWKDERAYYPIPVEFVHGMNSSPEAWGFQIDPVTEDVVGYTKTAEQLKHYYTAYKEDRTDPDTGEIINLPYLEPFNYSYNTFDLIKWNAYDGWEDIWGNVHNGEQYPDARISEDGRLNRHTLYKFIHKPPEPPTDPLGGILAKYQTTKTNLVAHSLGGVVSRYYINKTQGANVKQLTTLGTPHKGATVATVVQYTILDPITDPHGDRKVWRIIFLSLFSQMTVDREPFMIYDLKPSSQFIADLNSSIPAISRYYCIGGVISAGPFVAYTDGFIELVSAVAERRTFLPLVLPEESEIGSILPNYKSRILVPGFMQSPLENKHTKLPEKWEEILKAIDPVGRVEITEPKDGFSPPDEGELIVKGRVYDEYLPADCKVMVWVLREDELDMRVINNPNPEPNEPEWVWRLQPTDLWRADDPNSPVAEFEIHIPAEYAMKVEKVKITITNPGGYTSEDEVTWNLLIVDEGTKEVYCLDGPVTIRANYPKVVNEFRLVDEEGNEIESRPLGVAWDDVLGIFYVSFDDKKIRAYNEYGELMKTNSGRGYLEVPEMPDGLVNPFYNGWSYYVSEEASKVRSIDYFNESVFATSDVVLHIPPERYGEPWDVVKVNPTDGVYEYRYPLGSLGFWYSSGEMGLIRRKVSYWPPYASADSIPLGFSPTGLIQRGPYFYFVSLDGRLYKKYCKNAEGGTVLSRSWEGSNRQYDNRLLYRADSYSILQGGYIRSFVNLVGEVMQGRSRSFRRYDISELPEVFQSVKIPMLIHREGYNYSNLPQWVKVNVYLDIIEGGWDFEEIYWDNQPETLEPLSHLIYPLFYLDRYWYDSWEEVIVDATDVIRNRLSVGEKTLDIRCKTDEEGEYIERSAFIYLGPMYVEETTWAIDLPTDSPSDLGLGGKLKMRIKPGYPTSVNIGDIIQLETHGKEPLEWITSDGNVGKVDTNGLFTAVDKGTCTVTVTDTLRNMATSGDILVQ